MRAGASGHALVRHADEDLAGVDASVTLDADQADAIVAGLGRLNAAKARLAGIVTTCAGCNYHCDGLLTLSCRSPN